MRDISNLNLAEIGKFVRTHGYKGALILRPLVDFQLPLKTEALFIHTDGIRVPFFLLTDAKKYKKDLMISFDDILSEKDALKLVGKFVSIESKYLIIKEDETDPHQFIGFEVFDNEMFVGFVSDYLPLPANPILSVTTHQKEELLIPINTPFLKRTDIKNRQLFFELPAGLYDINS